MENSAKKLNELIKICNDGKEFYTKGIQEVESKKLKSLFTIMATAREKAIQDLEPFVEGRGYEVESSGTVAGKIRQGYTAMQQVFRDDEKVLIEQLEENEDRTLAAFKDALNEDLPTNIDHVLSENLATFSQTHDAMRNLKKSL